MCVGSIERRKAPRGSLDWERQLMWTVDLLSASRDIMQCQLHRRQLSQLSHHPALTTSTAQTCDKVTVNTQLANFNFLPQSEVGGEPHNQRDGEAGGLW